MKDRIDPVNILVDILRFDTTNPPGNERECILHMAGLFKRAGFKVNIHSKDSERPNLVTKLEGSRQAPPFLMYGHLDVVTAQGQTWTRPPFEGKIDQDFIWGRGTLDMKGGVAMMSSALLRAKYSGLIPKGDIIFVLVSDEEAGGDFGARFLVEEYPDYFKGVQYAIGEFGGFSLYAGNKKFYPIMVSEKQTCWMRAVIKGPGGHGSMPARGGTMAELVNLLAGIEKKRLPVHLNQAAVMMIKSIAGELPAVKRLMLNLLLVPAFTDLILGLLGESGRNFDPILHNTLNPTIINGGKKINVVPSEINLGLDGRLLPGFTPKDMIKELRTIIGKKVEIQVERFDPVPEKPDMGLFDFLRGILRKADPDGVPVPMLLPGTTDGRYFSRLGIQTYGFLPMDLPPEFNFTGSIHGPDERIPEKTLAFGTDVILRVIENYGNSIPIQGRG